MKYLSIAILLFAYWGVSAQSYQNLNSKYQFAEGEPILIPFSYSFGGGTMQSDGPIRRPARFAALNFALTDMIFPNCTSDMNCTDLGNIALAEGETCGDGTRNFVFTWPDHPLSPGDSVTIDFGYYTNPTDDIDDTNNIVWCDNQDVPYTTEQGQPYTVLETNFIDPVKVTICVVSNDNAAPQTVPTLGEWSIIILTLLILMIGAVALHYYKKSHIVTYS